MNKIDVDVDENGIGLWLNLENNRFQLVDIECYGKFHGKLTVKNENESVDENDLKTKLWQNLLIVPDNHISVWPTFECIVRVH